jgi:hypothetical protein
MDYYSQVVRLLQEAGCQRIALLRSGVEGWESPRTGRFTVDNPIRSLSSANNIRKNARLAPVLR